MFNTEYLIIGQGKKTDEKGGAAGADCRFPLGSNGKASVGLFMQPAPPPVPLLNLLFKEIKRFAKAAEPHEIFGSIRYLGRYRYQQFMCQSITKLGLRMKKRNRGYTHTRKHNTKENCSNIGGTQAMNDV